MKPLPIGRRLPGEKFQDYVQRALEEIERSSFDLSATLPDVNPRAGGSLRNGGVWFPDSKGLTISAPLANEDVQWFETTVPITVVALSGVLVGGGGPSLTTTVRFSPDRSANGTELIVGGTAFTSTTTRQVVTTFTNPVIPPGFVWIETTAKSGTVDQIALNLYF
jgi:hypothetical protein